MKAMGKALYRTYRSKSLSEILGQEHITQTLSNALKAGAVSHAYLFTGPKGVGKTSTARILAYEINKLPYDENGTHLDIIEIDAASNRRIDEIRSLRDKVHIAPSSAKFKVYIIDEVHMLTREAFNALLKTLEEPPAHAVFILATTEVHKLPETIISRTQRFTFKPIASDEVVAHLQHIAKKEKITIDDKALRLIAEHGEGSFRDSISLLDQARNLNRAITYADIAAMLGIAPVELLGDLLGAISTHQPSTLCRTLQQLYDQGSDPRQIAAQCSAELRKQVVSKTYALPYDTLFVLLAKLVEVAASSDPKVFLEIILLEATLANQETALATPKVGTKKESTAPSAGAKVPAQTVQAPQKAATTKAAAPSAPPAQSKAPAPAETQKDTPSKVSAEPIQEEETAASTTLNFDTWQAVLNAIKKKYSTLYGIVKTAEPHFSPGTLTLTFSKSFHQKRTNDTKNKQVIAEAITALIGDAPAIICKLNESQPAAVAPVEGEIRHTVTSRANANEAPGEEDADYYVQQAEAEAAARPMTAVSNIFGGGELLES